MADATDFSSQTDFFKTKARLQRVKNGTGWLGPAIRSRRTMKDGYSSFM